MKHLIPFRIYEAETTSGLTEEQEEFLNQYIQGTWSVNPSTGLVDVQGSFIYENKKAISFFWVKFGNVTGDFKCSDNQLRSLEGAPQTVEGNFLCSHNKLKSLKGAPKKVGMNFVCSNNELKTLKGAPQTIGRSFACSANELESLEGAPKKVDGNFFCGGNQLQSLKGAPQTVHGDFKCDFNPLQSLEGAPKKIKGKFKCNEFELYKGGWNIEGWLKILETELKAKKLILTIPFLNATYWNSKISENPKSAIINLSEFWDDLPYKVRNSIRIPPDLKDDFDNLVDLVGAGIF